MLSLFAWYWRPKEFNTDFGGYRSSFYATETELQKYGVEFVYRDRDEQRPVLCWHTPFYVHLARKVAKDRKLVAYTMFETINWPKELVENVELADHIIVPNNWNKESLINQGVTKPIDVWPHGYEAEYFPYIEREITKPISAWAHGYDHEIYTFLHYNAGEDRKGWDLVLKAFLDEFKQDEPVKLILKTRDMFERPVNEFLSNYTKPNKALVEVERERLSRTQQLDLAGRSDCFVFPSRGEGLGLPPLEMASTGMPVILTQAHAHLEFWNDGFLGVRSTEAKTNYVELLSHAEHVRLSGIEMKELDEYYAYDADIEDLRAKMRWCFEHQQEAKELGKRGSQFVQQNWTAQARVPHFAELLKKVYAN